MNTPSAGETDDYYATLGVTRQATPEELKKAFYRLARQYAPDKHVNEANFSDECMKKLTRAYNVLSNQDLKRNYDAKVADDEFEDDIVHDDLPSLPKGKRISESIELSLKSWKAEWNEKTERNFASEFPTALDEGVLKDVQTKERSYGLLAHEKLLAAFDVTGLTYLDDSLQNRKLLSQIKTSFYHTESAPWFGNSNPPSIKTEGSVECIYDLEELKSTPIALAQLFEAFGPSKTVLQLTNYFPKCKIKKKCQPSKKASNCTSCKKEFSIIGFHYACNQCGRDFCYDCVVSAKIFKIGGIPGRQEFCKQCIEANRIEDAELWFQKACELIVSEESLQPGFRCFKVAMELRPGYDDRLLKLVRSEKRPERSIAIALELIQLEKLPNDIFLQLQMHFADRLLERYIMVSTAKDAASLAMEYNFLSLAGVCFSEIACQLLEQGGSPEFSEIVRQKSAETNDLTMDALSRINTDQAVFGPFLEDVKNSILWSSFSNFFTSLKKRPKWQITAFIRAAVLRLESESFERTLSNDQLAVFEFVKGLSFVNAGNSANDTLEGFGKIEHAFWKSWHRCDEIGQSLLDALQFVTEEGYSLPYEALLSSAILDHVDIESAIPKFFLSGDQLLPPKERLWPELSLMGRNLKPIIKFESAIHKNLYKRTPAWKPIDAALAYWDMLDLCEHPSEHIVCLLNSSLYALQQLKEAIANDEPEREWYSLAKFVLESTNNAMIIAYRVALPPPLKYYASRLSFSIAVKVGRLTCFSLAAKEADKYLQTAVFYAPLCPALLPPTVLVSEAVLLTLAYSSIYPKYLNCLSEIEDDQSPISKAHLKYFLYEHSIRSSDCSEGQLEGVREGAMNEMLNERNLSSRNVRDLIASELVTREKGWLVRSKYLLGPVKTGFLKVNGVAINKETQQIRLLVSKPNLLSNLLGNPKFMISWNDIATLFCEDITKVPPLFFSLDQPDDKLSFHPFQTFRYEPRSIEGSAILNTLFHTDYLLKQFAMGVEISSEAPFEMRPASNGVLHGLPQKLVQVLKSVRDRGGQQFRMSRMWIQTDELAYDMQSTKDEILFVFGNMKVTVRSHPLMPNSEGKLEDADEDEETREAKRNSSEGKFCQDVTDHYAELADEFPEFARIIEIAKLHAVLRILHGYRANLSDKAANFTLDNNQVQEILRITRLFDDAVREAENEARNRLASVKREVMSKISGTSYNIDDGIVIDGFVEQFSSAMSKATRSEVRDAVTRWLRYDNECDMVHLIVKANCPSRPPDSTQMTAQIRQQFASNLRRLDATLANFQSECRRLCNYQPAKDESAPNDNKKAPWVPAVCHVAKDPAEGTTSIIYGGVMATPVLKQRDAPPYRGAVSQQLVAETLTAQGAKPPTRIGGSGSSGSGGNNNSSGKKARSKAGQQKTARQLAKNNYNNTFYKVLPTLQASLDLGNINLKQEHGAMGRNEKGWLQQEMNHIERSKNSLIKRKYIRNPSRYQWAHFEGREAKDGFDYAIENVRLLFHLDHALMDARNKHKDPKTWLERRAKVIRGVETFNQRFGEARRRATREENKAKYLKFLAENNGNPYAKGCKKHEAYEKMLQNCAEKGKQPPPVPIEKTRRQQPKPNSNVKAAEGLSIKGGCEAADVPLMLSGVTFDVRGGRGPKM